MKKLLIGMVLVPFVLLIGCPSPIITVDGVERRAWSTTSISLLNYTESDVDVVLTYKDGSQSAPVTIAPLKEVISKDAFRLPPGDSNYFSHFLAHPGEDTAFNKESATPVVQNSSPLSQDNAYVTSITVSQSGVSLYESPIYLDRAGTVYEFSVVGGVDQDILKVLPFQEDGADSIYATWDTSNAKYTQAHVECYIGIFPAE